MWGVGEDIDRLVGVAREGDIVTLGGWYVEYYKRLQKDIRKRQAAGGQTTWSPDQRHKQVGLWPPGQNTRLHGRQGDEG